ncbi:hypothetical protein [Aeromonas veronii]|uniref:hypothetical protein n=1 Tax=Aeromonas veronii TaxID=654 RepID=UPI002B48C494|nr:hypothetical protein [Aeromonas veronii]
MTERKKAGVDKLEQNTKVEVAQTDVVEANTQPITCGLIMPIATNEIGTAEHWSQVRTIIEDALKNTNLKVQMVSESDEVNVIHHNIVTNIYSNDIVICDVSSRNPNVMFELGMRLTFDKPVVIVKDRETPFSFDVGNIQHIEYPRSLNYVEIQKFQDELKNKTLSTLAASQAAGYSPFLSHYKIKHVAKVDTEVVGRDDYILSSLSEIANRIKRIESASNVGSLFHESSFTLPTNYIRSSERLHTVRLNSIASSLFNHYLKQYGDKIKNNEIAQMCREKIDSDYSDLSDSDRQLIFERVADLVSADK